MHCYFFKILMLKNIMLLYRINDGNIYGLNIYNSFIKIQHNNTYKLKTSFHQCYKSLRFLTLPCVAIRDFALTIHSASITMILKSAIDIPQLYVTIRHDIYRLIPIQIVILMDCFAYWMVIRVLSALLKPLLYFSLLQWFLSNI